MHIGGTARICGVPPFLVGQRTKSFYKECQRIPLLRDF